MKYIKNGKIILKDKIVCGKVLAYDSKINAIIDEDKIAAGADVINANGGYIAPGLIDVHIHGYLGLDVCDGNPDDIRKISAGIAQNGVTGWLPTTMTVDKTVILNAYNSVRSVMAESKNWNGATVLGVHSEGPFINPKKKGAQEERFILKPDADMIIENSDVVKYITMAPEMDPDFAAIRKIV
ncbi:MAG: amidohydrolase family protein, partial [Clostridia bacterium]